MKCNLDELVQAAVTDVFASAFEMPVKPEPTGALILAGETHVAGAVGFIGDMTGVVYIYCTARLARRIAANAMGLDESGAEADDMINDTVGEIANMVVGSVKAKLVERGVQCTLTIPSIVRGSNFVIECVTQTERAVRSFRSSDNHQIVTEVLLQPSDSN
jgi:chemotaxis protein CheX